MASASPDTHARSLPTAWITQDSLENIAEALDALENYKKKDAAKGARSPILVRGISNTLNATFFSRCAIQGRR